MTDSQHSAKRYDRILKSYNVEKPSAGRTAAAPHENGSATPKKKQTPRKKGNKGDQEASEELESPSKKRKVAAMKSKLETDPVKEEASE